MLSSRTPLVLDDVQQDPRFAREVAEGTGYVPKGLMAVPLLDDEDVLGVLQVLDRPAKSRFSLQEMELLGLFAGQAAIALALLGSARRARRALEGEGDAAAVAALAAALESLEGDRRERRGGAAPRPDARPRGLRLAQRRGPAARALFDCLPLCGAARVAVAAELIAVAAELVAVAAELIAVAAQLVAVASELCASTSFVVVLQLFVL